MHEKSQTCLQAYSDGSKQKMVFRRPLLREPAADKNFSGWHHEEGRSPQCWFLCMIVPIYEPIGKMNAIYGNIYHQYPQMLASIYH